MFPFISNPYMDDFMQLLRLQDAMRVIPVNVYGMRYVGRTHKRTNHRR